MLLELKGHAGSVRSVAVSPDGRRIVTGSDDHHGVDARTGAMLLELKGHAGSVRSVAVTPDGRRIVTGSVDRTARIWDINTGAELVQLKGHTGTIWSVVVTADGAATSSPVRQITRPELGLVSNRAGAC